MKNINVLITLFLKLYYTHDNQYVENVKNSTASEIEMIEMDKISNIKIDII